MAPSRIDDAPLTDHVNNTSTNNGIKTSASTSTSTATTTTPGLSPSQLHFFNQNGYLIIPDALSPETVSSLLGETHRMLDEFSLDDHPMTKFSTGRGKDEEHVGDEYFLGSGDKVRFFFEEDAIDSTGALTKPKARAINKIGHYLHVLSPPFASLTSPVSSPPPYHPSAIAHSLGFTSPRCLQSMIICKQPEIGGAVGPHQDSVFLYTDPPSAVGFWYALEDATQENGCLSFWPGSHKWAAVRQRFVRKVAADASSGERNNAVGVEFIENSSGAQFPPGDQTTGVQYGEHLAPPDVDVNGEKEGHDAAPKGRDDQYVLGEVKAGTLVLIHGNVLHRSERNTSQKGRIIYTFHVIEGEEAGARYDGWNWLQPPEGGFTRL